MSARQWFVLDQVGDEIMILTPDGAYVRGRIVGHLGGKGRRK